MFEQKLQTCTNHYSPNSNAFFGQLLQQQQAKIVWTNGKNFTHFMNQYKNGYQCNESVWIVWVNVLSTDLHNKQKKGRGNFFSIFFNFFLSYHWEKNANQANLRHLYKFLLSVCNWEWQGAVDTRRVPAWKDTVWRTLCSTDKLFIQFVYLPLFFSFDFFSWPLPMYSQHFLLFDQLNRLSSWKFSFHSNNSWSFFFILFWKRKPIFGFVCSERSFFFYLNSMIWK